MEGAAAARRVCDILDTAPASADASSQAHGAGVPATSRPKCDLRYDDITLDGVSLAYPGLKTTKDMHQRSRLLAGWVAPFTSAAVTGFIIWTHVTAGRGFFLNVIELIAVLAATWLVWEHRDGFAFTATTITVAACILTIFVDLYPNVMISSTNSAYNLTVHNTASAHYSFTAMTVVVIFLPLVLAYQAWTCYVFRRRVSASDFQPPVPPPRAEPEPAPPRPATPPVRPGS